MRNRRHNYQTFSVLRVILYRFEHLAIHNAIFIVDTTDSYELLPHKIFVPFPIFYKF